MSKDIAISLQNVSKAYRRYNHPQDRLQEILFPGKSKAETFWALRNIDLQIPRGETVGIIGRNGSGKSTLLQIIAGTLQATSGEVLVSGRVSALLELGSGFNPEFTGSQNVFFNGRILGLSTEEIEQRFDAIASFADIGEFIDQPVKTYSSGMFVRLAFAVAVHVEPEIFIVDEALAVGDIVFQHKCMRRIKSLMDSGVTTLFVSHDASAVKSLCNYAFLLHEGSVLTQGMPNDVFIDYMKLVTKIELEQSEDEVSKDYAEVGNDTLDGNQSHDLINNINHNVENPSRRGSGRARIENVRLLHEDGKLAVSSPVFKFREKITLAVDVCVYSKMENFILGFYICDKNGNEILGSNTNEEDLEVGSLNPGDKATFSFTFNLPLRPGGYSLTVAGAENYTSTTCDWIDNIVVFKVLPPNNGKFITAMVDIPMDVELKIRSNEASDSFSTY